MLGLFAGLGVYGGIPASGLLAWEKMVETFDAPQQLYLFCYSNGQDWYSTARVSKRQVPKTTACFTVPAVFASSRLSASMAALGRRWPVRTVLVWHIGLLKLLPFLRVSGARVILFLHGIEIWEYRSWLDRLSLRQVDLFLSNSDFTWGQFVEANPRYFAAPHRTVHLGIGSPVNGDASTVTGPARTAAALMLGRLNKREDYKGHREVINAWPAVIERIPDAELWIVGDGDLREELEQLPAARKLRDKIRFFGRVSEEKKQEMIAQCRCLALPSRGEGFGLVYLEAMRMGRPCLVSTLDAGREVVNPPEAGLAADLDRAEDLVGAFRELLQPGPRWDSWSANARRRYEAAFTAEHFQQRLISALDC